MSRQLNNKSTIQHLLMKELQRTVAFYTCGKAGVGKDYFATNVSPCTWLQMCFELTISFLTLLWMEWTKILWESSFWQGYFANVCFRILRYDNLVNVAHQRKSIYMIVDVFWTYNIISNITLDGMNKTLVESQLLTRILSKCKLQNSSIRQTDQPGATT